MSLSNYRNPGQNSRLWRVYVKSVLKYGTTKKYVNALRTELAYRRKDVVVASQPYILFVEPLYYCNLDCPLCDRQVFPTARGTKDAGKLALDLYDRILDEIGDSLFQCQIFGQGEPLMNWRLTKEIIQKTHDRGIFSYMSTNATLITPKMADDIVASDLDYLVCAIDGTTQESYETYRTGGQYADAMNGIRLVSNARKRTRSKLAIEWQFLVHAHNVHQIPEAKRIAAELGVHIRFGPLCGMEWDKELEDYWYPKSGEWKRVAAPLEASNKFPCYFLWRSLVLNSNGKVARCLIYQNATQYADLHSMPAMAAYNHPSVQAARRLFRAEDPGSVEAPVPCRSCHAFERHHGAAIKDRNSDIRAQLTKVPT